MPLSSLSDATGKNFHCPPPLPAPPPALLLSSCLGSTAVSGRTSDSHADSSSYCVCTQIPRRHKHIYTIFVKINSCLHLFYTTGHNMHLQFYSYRFTVKNSLFMFFWCFLQPLSSVSVWNRTFYSRWAHFVLIGQVWGGLRKQTVVVIFCFLFLFFTQNTNTNTFVHIWTWIWSNICNLTMQTTPGTTLATKATEWTAIYGHVRMIRHQFDGELEVTLQKECSEHGRLIWRCFFFFKHIFNSCFGTLIIFNTDIRHYSHI